MYADHQFHFIDVGQGSEAGTMNDSGIYCRLVFCQERGVPRFAGWKGKYTTLAHPGATLAAGINHVGVIAGLLGGYPGRLGARLYNQPYQGRRDFQ